MAEFLLRLPDDLYEKLREIAKREDRCINGQITHIIRKHIKDYFKRLDNSSTKNAPEGADTPTEASKELEQTILEVDCEIIQGRHAIIDGGHGWHLYSSSTSHFPGW